jgi:hypothetical protein
MILHYIFLKYVTRWNTNNYQTSSMSRSYNIEFQKNEVYIYDGTWIYFDKIQFGIMLNEIVLFWYQINKQLLNSPI